MNFQNFSNAVYTKENLKFFEMRTYKCPDCGHDIRNINEIVSDLEEIYDCFNEDEDEGYESKALDETIDAALKLQHVIIRPHKVTKLKKIKELLDNIDSLSFRLNNVKLEEDEREEIELEILNLQKVLKKSLKEVDLLTDNPEEMK